MAGVIKTHDCWKLPGQSAGAVTFNLYIVKTEVLILSQHIIQDLCFVLFAMFNMNESYILHNRKD